jgi:hypothetical protein
MAISHGERIVTKASTGPRIGLRGRTISGTALACVVLAFLLPFGSVASCSSDEAVGFTGLQLATAQVPADETTPGGTLHEQVESDATAVAFLTLAAAVIGLGLVAAGRAGGGICAGAGLVGLQLIVWTGLVAWDSFDLYEGFGLSFLAFAVAGLTHLVVAVRARRRAGRRSWTYALRSTALALAPTLALAALVVVGGAAGW